MARILQVALDKKEDRLSLDFDPGGGLFSPGYVRFRSVLENLDEQFSQYKPKLRDPEGLKRFSSHFLESGEDFFRLVKTEKGSIWLDFNNGTHIIPFENLIIDGDFISRQFSISRRLAVPRAASGHFATSPWLPPIRVLLVLGPVTWKDGSPYRRELDDLRVFFASLGQERVNVEVFDQDEPGSVTIRLARAMSEAHIVHYIGQGVDSGKAKKKRRWGWEFQFGQGGEKKRGQVRPVYINAGEIFETGCLNNAPHLVFSNSCCGACYRHLPNPNGGLAADFMAAGVRHFVGCPQNLPEGRPHTDFALAFYERLLKEGDSVGEAMRRARVRVSELHPGDPTWHLYQLFGKPDDSYTLTFHEKNGGSGECQECLTSGEATANFSGIRRFSREFSEKWETNSSVLEIVTFDDDEALCWLREFCRERGIRLLEFTPSEGFREARFGAGGLVHETIAPAGDFDGLLPLIGQRAEGADGLMAVFVVDRLSGGETRMLSEFSRHFRAARSLPPGKAGEPGRKKAAAVILARDVIAPPGLARQMDVLSFPVPGLGEMDRLASEECESLNSRLGSGFSRDFAFCLQGMTKAQAKTALSMCRLVCDGWTGEPEPLKDELFRLASERKSRSVSRFLPLSFTDWRMLPKVRFLSQGSPERQEFKRWVKNRVKLVPDQPERTRDALKFPRGMLVCGPPGSGRTAAVHHLAARWRLPVYQLDMNAVYPSLARPEDRIPEDGAYLARFMRALSTVENSAPNILLLENVDRHFPVLSEGGDDSGPSAASTRLLGYFLTWLQERTDPVFVALTAGDARNVDPQMSRKGRLDRVFDFTSSVGSGEFGAALLREFFRRKGLSLSSGRLFGGRVSGFASERCPAEMASLVDEALASLFCSGIEKPDAGDLAARIMERPLYAGRAAWPVGTETV